MNSKIPLFPPRFFLGQKWQQRNHALDEALRASDAKSLHHALAEISPSLRVIYHGRPDFQPVLDELVTEESGEFSLFWTTTLPRIVELAKMAPDVLNKEVTLLTAKCNSSLILSRQQVAVILALAFLGFIPDATGRSSMLPLVWPRDGCAFSPNVEKLKCFLHYFNESTIEETFHRGSLVLERQTLDAGDMARFSTLDGWALSNTPLRNVTVFPLGVSLDEADAPAHVDFANASAGGGIFLNTPGSTAQEEILFAMHPELSTATILAREPLLEDEVLLIRGARCLARHTGYLDTFRYAGPAWDTGFDPRIHIVMDANRYFGDDTNRPFSINLATQIRTAGRDLRKALCGFRSVARVLSSENESPIVGTGNWGSGAFGGEPSVKALLQWMAASEAGVDLEYFPYDDELLQSILPSILATARQSDLTVGLLMRVLLDIAHDASIEGPNEHFLNDGRAFLDAVKQRMAAAAGSLYISSLRY